MRALLSPLLVIATLLISAHASAQWNDDKHFSFNIFEGDPGCAKISYINTYNDCPNIGGAEVTSVRFYYSKLDAESVTEESPFEETMLNKDEYGQYTVTPNEFCGLGPGHYYFKYGLFDSTNNLLEFSSESDSYGNDVEIVDPNANPNASSAFTSHVP